jgi:hypothetical protein
MVEQNAKMLIFARLNINDANAVLKERFCRFDLSFV